MKRFIETIILVVVGVEAGGAQTVRDSAGVTIVESEDSSWSDGEAWTVSGVPSLSLGAVDGDHQYLFSEVEAVVLLSDGRLAVADRGSNEIRLFRLTLRPGLKRRTPPRALATISLQRDGLLWMRFVSPRCGWG